MRFIVSAINKIHESWGEDTDDFFVQAHFEVEQEGGSGGEAILVCIASPKALASQLAKMLEPEIGRGYLLMEDYDEQSALMRLQALVDSSGAETWEQLQRFLERYFDWID
jgi:hypothetical protein